MRCKNRNDKPQKAQLAITIIRLRSKTVEVAHNGISSISWYSSARHSFDPLCDVTRTSKCIIHGAKDQQVISATLSSIIIIKNGELVMVNVTACITTFKCAKTYRPMQQRWEVMDEFLFPPTGNDRQQFREPLLYFSWSLYPIKTPDIPYLL